MEIGSFLEIQFLKGKEFYKGSVGIARLNSGRAAIYHAIYTLGCKTVWLPYYQCDTVRDFLNRKGIAIKYYHIDSAFNPVDAAPQDYEAIVFVNYYGVFSAKAMKERAAGYKNVIFDNSQAFFAEPCENAVSVYSARKFVGVPDGAYVIGKNAEKHVEKYPQGYSSDTSLFLLQRVEYGCEGKSYISRKKNEDRIDTEDISKMSKLTHAILDGTDYDFIAKKRKDNFGYVARELNAYNKLDATRFYDEGCVPMVYPLVLENDRLLDKLLQAKHFQGHWWSYLLEFMPKDSFEYWLSRFIIPITVDQRYEKRELAEVIDVIRHECD